MTLTLKTWVLGIGVFLALLASFVAAIWFYWAPPITKEEARQEGNQNVTLKANTVLT